MGLYEFGKAKLNDINLFEIFDMCFAPDMHLAVRDMLPSATSKTKRRN